MHLSAKPWKPWAEELCRKFRCGKTRLQSPDKQASNLARGPSAQVAIHVNGFTVPSHHVRMPHSMHSSTNTPGGLPNSVQTHLLLDPRAMPQP